MSLNCDGLVKNCASFCGANIRVACTLDETVKFTLTDIICDRFCFYKVLKVHRTTPQKLSSPRLRLQVLRVKGCRRATILYSGKSTILCYSRADPPLAFKGPCKRSQHCWPTRRNNVGPKMLRAFAHHVVCCCVLLRLGSCWMKIGRASCRERV